MGARKKKQEQEEWARRRPEIKELFDQQFRDKVKSIQCPKCDLAYTDFAVEWAKAWWKGWRDCYFEQGFLELPRDGRSKLKCELCGAKAWLGAFGGRSVELDSD